MNFFKLIFSAFVVHYNYVIVILVIGAFGPMPKSPGSILNFVYFFVLLNHEFYDETFFRDTP